jgi:hypothetical protein
MLPKKRIQLGAGVAMIGLAACSGSGVTPSTHVTTANVSTNVLQFAAGTANIAGAMGLNVVVTYRQASNGYKPGDSGSLVNSVSLSGPFTLSSLQPGNADSYYSTIETGPAASEVHGSTMGSTPQTGSTTATTFGTSGQASGLGLEPYNYNNGSVPDSVAPYTLPLYDPNTADPNAFVPWGGPPAFDPNHDGEGVRDVVTGSATWPWAVPVGTLGVSEGIDVFQGITPSTTSPYTLTVTVPGQTAGSTAATQQASFTIKNPTMLGAATAPTVTTSTDTTGNTTLSVTLNALPTGATEAYVQIVDLGPNPTSATQAPGCNFATAMQPVYYTLFFNAPGTKMITGLEGPRSSKGPTPSICTATQNTAYAGSTMPADTFTVQEIGFDYPAYESSYPNSLGNPAPTILGPNGQDDVTISPVATYTAGTGTTWTMTASSTRLLRSATIIRR